MKIGTPHFKLHAYSTFFRRGRNKKVLEFDVEKDGGIISHKKIG